MEPKAFLSYAHFDDEDGHLTELHTMLTREVRRFSGIDFTIFRDKTDIKWGESWKKRIKESLDEVTFFIPVITPMFLNSDECRSEVQLFLEHEQQLERDDLIFPLYFVESLKWDDEQQRQDDEVVRELRSHQCVNWKQLRGRPFEDQEVKVELENLARQIRDALERVKAAGGDIENKPSRTGPPTRISQTGTIISSVPAEGQEVQSSLHERAERRLIAVNMRLIKSQAQVISDLRSQALNLAKQEEYQEAIDQLDVAVRNGLLALNALERSSLSTEDDDTQEASQ
jgi:hypothetical protein